jgi:hypothetical protein
VPTEPHPHRQRVLIVGGAPEFLCETVSLQIGEASVELELGWVVGPYELQVVLAERWDLILYDVTAGGVEPHIVLGLVRTLRPDLPVLVTPGVSGVLVSSPNGSGEREAWGQLAQAVRHIGGTRAAAVGRSAEVM